MKRNSNPTYRLRIFQVRLSGGVLHGRSSIRKILVREGKSRAAIAVLVGINKHNPLG